MYKKSPVKAAFILHAVVAMFVFLTGCATGVAEDEAAKAYYDLGNAYFELERYNDAVTAYAQAMELDPGIVQAGYNLARVYIETGKIDKGIAVLADLADNDPNNLTVTATLAWAHYRDGRLEDALEGYTAVLRETPDDNDALYNSAVIAWKLGRLQDAISSFEQYHKYHPEGDTLKLLGTLYEENGDPEGALKYFELYAADNKPGVDLLESMARAYEQIEEYGKAASTYAELLDRDSSRGEARFRYSRVLLEKIEDYQTGMEQLRIAVDSGYNDEESLLQLLTDARSYYKADLEKLLSEKGIASNAQVEEGLDTE